MKRDVVEQALKRCEGLDDLFERLSQVSDNMLIFNAGFVLGLQGRDIKTVLAGGTQMAALLLLINSVVNLMEVPSAATTSPSVRPNGSLKTPIRTSGAP